MQKIDQLEIRSTGISSEAWIERAGRAFAAEILQDKTWDHQKKCWIFVGPGHNGDDGRALAALLGASGLKVHLWTLNSAEDIPSVATLSSAGLLVDALFGIGLSRPLTGRALEVVQNINGSRAPVTSLDVPSGLDADRGVSLGGAIQASTTLTVELAKPGFFIEQGPRHIGRLKILKIGFDRGLFSQIANDTFLVTGKMAGRLQPRIPSASANKTDFGRVLAIGGSANMEGALVLAATAAARAGAGYVTLCSPKPMAWDHKPADFLSLPWKKLENVEVDSFSSLLIGPGLRSADLPTKVWRRLIDSGLRTVIDAGALSLTMGQGKRLHGNCVITPHAGELSRLVGRSAKQIEGDRLFAAREAVQILGGNVLLKGFRTVVDDGQKSFLIGSGNVALAKAGTGDVLSGFIGGFAAQGLAIREAAVFAAYVHGAMADEWVRQGYGFRTLLASDLANWYKIANARFSRRTRS